MTSYGHNLIGDITSTISNDPNQTPSTVFVAAGNQVGTSSSVINPHLAASLANNGARR